MRRIAALLSTTALLITVGVIATANPGASIAPDHPLTLNPSAPVIGNVLTSSGADCAAHTGSATVLNFLNGDPTFGTSTNNPDGTFSTDFTADWAKGSPGWYQVIGQCGGLGTGPFWASPIFFANNGTPVQPLTITTGPSDDGTLYYASGTGCFPQFQIVLLDGFDASGKEYAYSGGNSKADGTFAINLGLTPPPAGVTLVASCGLRATDGGGITVLYNGSETPPPTPPTPPSPGGPTTTKAPGSSSGAGATSTAPHFTG